ncbi:MAG TPA: circadian clock KaiB family protein [Ideonella sp.]|uniref:circadian clock KaiB family protein n=1 Tax=Ideonella sp. TaxID=1929293 RepID=UPI002C8725F8|nr:circadian clock KaiB family protein [Ideonella sp.]HSI47468.1 circadian clock KaiB family protein [Ideonella sp.]
MNAGPDMWVLRLYVAGQSPRSLRAQANIRRICSDLLPGRHDLEVIDLYQQPELAQDAQIVALPTLVKQLPGPRRVLIGDLSNTQDVLRELELT